MDPDELLLFRGRWSVGEAAVRPVSIRVGWRSRASAAGGAIGNGITTFNYLLRKAQDRLAFRRNIRSAM
jgi:hypothetical protein